MQRHKGISTSWLGNSCSSLDKNELYTGAKASALSNTWFFISRPHSVRRFSRWVAAGTGGWRGKRSVTTISTLLTFKAKCGVESVDEGPWGQGTGSTVANPTLSPARLGGRPSRCRWRLRRGGLPLSLPISRRRFHCCRRLLRSSCCSSQPCLQRA